MFIGINDICSLNCDKLFPDSPTEFGHPAYYETQVRNMIESIRLNLPRTIVNIFSLFNISQINDWTNGVPHCEPTKFVRENMHCPCLSSQAGKDLLDQRVVAYNQVLDNIQASYMKNSEKDNAGKIPLYEDFAVILSPTFKDIHLQNNLPIEFLSDFDCYHPSTLGHQIIAIATWY
jgi:phospholipase B1